LSDCASLHEQREPPALTTVTEHGAGVVEDHGVGFVIGGAQHAANHLPE